jgi:hypothetical protein
MDKRYVSINDENDDKSEGDNTLASANFLQLPGDDDEVEGEVDNFRSRAQSNFERVLGMESHKQSCCSYLFYKLSILR